MDALGLSQPCAQIWLANTINTRSKCTAVCLKNINNAYNLPDGSLNPCLQCDELKSGSVFKKVRRPSLTTLIAGTRGVSRLPFEARCPTFSKCMVHSNMVCTHLQVAGRTRRNSGLASAIWRRPASISPVDHYYY